MKVYGRELSLDFALLEVVHINVYAIYRTL